MAAFALRTANQWLESQLASGPWEILALTFLASAVVVPITQYRTLYGFTVGYGASVGWMGSYLLWLVLRTPSPFPSSEWSSPSRILVVSAIVYGFRLAIYLLLRDLGGWKPRAGLGAAISTGGAWTAVVAAVLEAVADAHKSWCKNRSAAARPGDFTGPTTGLYRITRHPNYSAEVVYWTGVWITGIPVYGTNVVAWIASSLGCYSIVMIMMGSTRRLEEGQSKRYGGQPAYQEWIKRVPSPLFPGIHQSNVRGFF